MFSCVLTQTRGPFTELHNFQEALEWAERGMEIDPTWWILMALGRYRMGDDEGALQSLQDIEEHRRDDGFRDEQNDYQFTEPLFTARVCSALILKRLGSMECAQEYYDKAVAIFPRQRVPNNEERGFLMEAGRHLATPLSLPI